MTRRTVELSLSTRTRQYLLAAGAALWLGWASFWAVSRLLGVRPDGTAVLAVAAGWVALSALAVRRYGPDEDGDAWGPISREQYAGRFAEAGGLTRREQEEALEDENH